MVSLDQIVSIEKELHKSPKANALYLYLKKEKNQILSLELGDTEKLYYSFLDALTKDDSSQFKSNYGEFSKRVVLKEQPILYDNYFLFILIIGVKKYSIDDSWIRSILSLRDTLNAPERLITVSFLNLIDNNYLSTDGIPSLILAALLKIDGEELNSTILQNSFKANNSIIQYLDKDLFLVLIYLFTNDYIISISIGSDSLELKKFEGRFLKRIALLQKIIYVLVLLTFLITWFYLINRYPRLKDLSGELETILGIIGVGLLAAGLEIFKKKIGRLIKRFFGYKEH